MSAPLPKRILDFILSLKRFGAGTVRLQCTQLKALFYYYNNNHCISVQAMGAEIWSGYDNKSKGHYILCKDFTAKWSSVQTFLNSVSSGCSETATNYCYCSLFVMQQDTNSELTCLPEAESNCCRLAVFTTTPHSKLNTGLTDPVILAHKNILS